MVEDAGCGMRCWSERPRGDGVSLGTEGKAGKGGEGGDEEGGVGGSSVGRR